MTSETSTRRPAPMHHWWLCGAVFFSILVSWSAARSQGITSGRGADVVSVSGRQLTLDGQPFRIRGVHIDALIAPSSWLEQDGNGGKGFPAYTRAYKHLIASGDTELAYARSYFHANTISFVVSQSGMDPQNSSFTAAQHRSYLADVHRAVALARGMGFVVILCDFDGLSVSGNQNRDSSFPTESTARVDEILARQFGADRGIMLEVYNEPWPPNQQSSIAALWDEYVRGGPGKNGLAEVGVNDIVRRMRSTGAKNVILVEPFFTKGWVGYPETISDPQRQLAFGVHPYMTFAGKTRAQWDSYFGEFSRTHLTVVTEWSENAGPLGNARYSWCDGPEALDLPRQKLGYFNDVGISGVVGWAFDIPGTLMDGLEGHATQMVRCGAPGSNVGEMLRSSFAAG